MIQLPLLTWEIMIGFVGFLLGLVLGIWKTNKLWFKCFSAKQKKKIKKSPFIINLSKFKSIIKTIFRCSIFILAGFGVLILLLLLIF